jgi:hypothetical protein
MLKILILVILFFLLTPGILWTYSKKTNKYSIAILHACVFAFVFYLIEYFSNTPIREGMQDIKGIKFGLKKDMEKDSAKINPRIEKIFKNAKKKYGDDLETSFVYDSVYNSSSFMVNAEGGEYSDLITKEDIMEPYAPKIFKFVEQIKKMNIKKKK